MQGRSNLSLNPSHRPAQPELAFAGVAPTVVLDATKGDLLDLPGGPLMLGGRYVRQGPDLLLVGPDGQTVLVLNYFSVATKPNLINPDGVVVPPDLVEVFTAEPPAKPPSMKIANADDPIGTVDGMAGAVFVGRADGTRAMADKDTPLYSGDTVQTADGTVALVFADGTRIGVGADTRVVLDRLTFDPKTKEGEIAFSVPEGTISFIGGDISRAGPESMMIYAPAANVTVRNASGSIRVGADGETSAVLFGGKISTDGQLLVANASGSRTLDGAYEAATVGQYESVPNAPYTMNPRQIGLQYGDAVQSLADADRHLSTAFLRVVAKAWDESETAVAEAPTPSPKPWSSAVEHAEAYGRPAVAEDAKAVASLDEILPPNATARELAETLRQWAPATDRGELLKEPRGWIAVADREDGSETAAAPVPQREETVEAAPTGAADPAGDRIAEVARLWASRTDRGELLNEARGWIAAVAANVSNSDELIVQAIDSYVRENTLRGATAGQVAAGQVAAEEAYRIAMNGGIPPNEALRIAIEAAELAAARDLASFQTAAGDVLTGSVGTDTLKGSAAGDGLAAATGQGGGDPVFGFGLAVGFDPLRPAAEPFVVGPERRDDPVPVAPAPVNNDDIIVGTAGDDTLTGGAGRDTVSGGDGDDTLIAGIDDGSNDTYYGGTAAADSGIDTIDYSAATASVLVDLSTGQAIGTSIGTDTLSGIENVVGSAYNDTITGDENANVLSGGAGDDTITGGRGDDTLIGGDGADEFAFAGGIGATVADRVQSLGLDNISDFLAGLDALSLSDADFGFGNAGTLAAANYFETAAALGGAPSDLSGGNATAGIVVIGAGAGTGGVNVYYTEDASAATNANSYQIAHIDGINTGDLSEADIRLRS